VGGSLLFSFDDFALDCEWRLLAIPQILPDCKAKKQERDRSDQIFFETVVEVAVGITTCAKALFMCVRP
jgi:hypothetical protein